ncbi:Hypothetical predicted protein [Lecanosticta acicola]|uniref:Uncharacterized protein n=1 Tax=Lecanosticta acicola TaxID=111012 RepID=A0AAI9ECJ4_9PEZI|nr:Hypothetical predicted protein [Lecanosticta acicola]
MHIEPILSDPFSSSSSFYPTPSSSPSSDTSYQIFEQDHPSDMGANTNVHVDGVGILNYQRAVDVARNTEGDLDPTVSAYLEGALRDIWSRITVQPNAYIMTKDEFAIFNFYRRRFDGDATAERAVARYWSHTYETPCASS